MGFAIFGDHYGGHLYEKISWALVIPRVHNIIGEESLMEPFDIRLDGEKICRRKSTTKKERDYLIRKIQGLSLDELTSFCLDKALTLSSIRITLSRIMIGSKHRGIR